MSPPEKRRVLILVGTDHHRFDRIVDWADRRQREHPDEDVFIQYSVSSRPTTANGAKFLDPPDLAAAVHDADVVITHGGPGTISNARTGGHRPLVVPRDPARGEHVDDHQLRFSRWAHDRNLVTRVPEVTGLDEAIEALGEKGTRWDTQVADDTAASVARVQLTVEEARGRHGRVPPPTAPLVLYIGGSGRSGSTLLESMLARLPGVVVLGEVAHLWERGIRNDELCACGEPFSRCTFWTAVGARAFGGWAEVDPEWVLTLKDAVDRQRRMLLTARRHPGAALRAQIIEYASYYERLFAAARDVAGAAVVVDSSKVAPTALAYSHDRQIDLRVMHILRDSRGVAYSWSKAVARPETHSEELMPQLSALDSTKLWASHNASIGLLRYRGVPVSRLRYEDLVTDPGPVVRRAWRALDLPGSGELPLLDPRTIELLPTHSVAGNPSRFRHGVTTLRPDSAWREQMAARDRKLVTALTLPGLAVGGYLRRRE